MFCARAVADSDVPRHFHSGHAEGVGSGQRGDHGCCDGPVGSSDCERHHPNHQRGYGASEASYVELSRSLSVPQRGRWHLHSDGIGIGLSGIQTDRHSSERCTNTEVRCFVRHRQCSRVSYGGSAVVASAVGIKRGQQPDQRAAGNPVGNKWPQRHATGGAGHGKIDHPAGVRRRERADQRERNQLQRHAIDAQHIPVDGGELNDRGCGGCFSSLPSIDALSEFQTLDSNYGPDYGIGSGGTIAMVIKSGSKQFHGSVWEFNRNEVYAANNFFLNRAGKARPEFRLNIPGGNFGGPLGKRTFFFVNEEWRRLIQGSTPTVSNTLLAGNFAALGQPLTYTVPSNGKAPIVPTTTDPAKLSLYTTDGLTAGSPFNAPGGGPCTTTCVIPANLIDQNAVLELNQGTFPHPNFGTSQYIASPSQPTNVREDVVRLDHNIKEKYLLMGHYLHDAVSQTYYPPLWGNSTYPTVGTAMLNPSWSSTIKLTQTYSGSLLNETSFLFSGNTIHLSPVKGPGLTTFSQPNGWTATSFFPVALNREARLPEIRLGGPYNTVWSPSYFPWKNSYFGYEPRDDVSWTRGRHQFKFGFSWLHDVKNQELQANTNGTAIFGNSDFSNDSYVNFLLGDADSFTQLQFLAGKHWVNNNYGIYGNDNWHVTQRLTLNLGLRYDAMPHAFERYNQFANFVPGQYDTSKGNPVIAAGQKGAGTINPADLTTFNGQPFYLNGIREAGVGGFPAGNVKNYYYTVEPRVGFAYSLDST